MKALETYPPRLESESLVSTAEDAYTHAKDFLEGIQLNQDKSSSTSKYRDHREKNLKHVGTMSKCEWEAVGMYLAFVFVKIDPEAEQKRAEEAERRAKERAEQEKEREERAKAEQEMAENAKAEEDKEEQAEENPEEKVEEIEPEPKAESRKRKHEEEPAEGDDDDGEPAAKKQETAEETSA